MKNPVIQRIAPLNEMFSIDIINCIESDMTAVELTEYVHNQSTVIFNERNKLINFNVDARNLEDARVIASDVLDSIKAFRLAE